MALKMNECLFCEMDQNRVMLANDLAYAIRDGFPVTFQHTLIIPKRHESDYFSLTKDELSACHELLLTIRTQICQEDPSVEGFNVGVNVGAAAGQTIFHCHIHVIPRRAGDVPDPRGGVRHLIPGKGFY
jgi:diadenosine tetraphosphate (Ap4A) HIT family hydrolase